MRRETDDIANHAGNVEDVLLPLASQPSQEASIVGADYRWIILSVAILSQTAFSLITQGVAPLAPFLQADLRLSLGQVGLLGTAMYAGCAALVLLAGHLVDTLGVRYVLSAGQILAGVVLALSAASQSLWQILLAFFFVGLGTTVSGPTTSKAIVSWFPMRARATAMGIKQTGVPIAGIITALALPVSALFFGWRTTLVFVGAGVALLGIVPLVLYRETQSSWNRPPLVIRDSWQTMLPVVRNRDISLASGAAWCYVAVQFGLITYLMLYLRDRLAVSVVVAGVYLALCQAGGVVGRLAWGAVSDRLFAGRRKPALTAIGLLSTILCLIVAFGSPQMGSITLGVLALALGICVIGWNALSLALVSELAGLEHAGTAVGLSLTYVYVGMMVGPPLFGLIVDCTANYSLAWAWLAVLCLAGATLSSLVHEEHRRI